MKCTISSTQISTPLLPSRYLRENISGEMLHQVAFIKWFHRIFYSYNSDLIIESPNSQHPYHHQFTHIHTGQGRSISVHVKVPIQISPWVQGNTTNPWVFLHRHGLHLEEKVFRGISAYVLSPTKSSWGSWDCFTWKKRGSASTIPWKDSVVRWRSASSPM